MTDDLLLKLRKALAFDEAMHVSECIARNEDDQSGLGMAIKDWCDGARFEARHRRKVDEALVSLVAALEQGEPDYNSAWSMICLMAEGEGSDWKVYQAIAKDIHSKLKPALERLRAVVEG